MWAPLAFGLLIGFIGQATNGTAGWAAVFGIGFLALIGYAVLRRPWRGWATGRHTR